ncbi:MAG: hypothetical protein DMF21_04420 [Verrucomicrobia bacterium]|nr:MAG: hypothetical protein DMF21_04420 [Verrucomicrobiota bacterium]
MRGVGRYALIVFEIAVLSTLILATRCANYLDVFVAGNVYFTDADCYARMTRVRMCMEHPGLIVRHHNFENFPQGTTPHTTAPLDYLIVALAVALKPLTAHAIDFAGAVVSPLLALIGGWFLWWWSRQMNFRYRWVMLMRWSAMSGIAWALAVWVSAYESLVLFFIVLAVGLVRDRKRIFAKYRQSGWIWFALVIAMVFLIERRIPSFAILPASTVFKNWSRTIGELAHVPPASPIWFVWAGYMIAVAPLLIWLGFWKKKSKSESAPVFVVVLLVATYCLTIWQARWAYFFLSIFAISLPTLLPPIRSRTAVCIAFVLSLFPILRDWDARVWPSEAEYARRIERRNESVQLRDLAVTLQSAETRAFLAPWWLSPSIGYWSRQPAVAGSSHESLPGIEESARFFLSEDWQTARKILDDRRVSWVIAYDFEGATVSHLFRAERDQQTLPDDC